MRVGCIVHLADDRGGGERMACSRLLGQHGGCVLHLKDDRWRGKDGQVLARDSSLQKVAVGYSTVEEEEDRACS